MSVRADTIGRVALLTVLLDDPAAAVQAGKEFRIARGHVGTMEVQKIIAAVETAARREELISDAYAEEHALYHATIEALHGIGRGQLALGAILRTAALRFAIVRGPRLPGDATTWVAVAMYGTIGQPVKGNEHEVAGLGIYHL